MAHCVQIEAGDRIVFDDNATIDHQRPERSPPTASHRANRHVVQAEIARVVQPVNREPNDTVLLVESTLPLRFSWTPIPPAGEAEAVLVKIEFALSAVVPER